MLEINNNTDRILNGSAGIPGGGNDGQIAGFWKIRSKGYYYPRFNTQNKIVILLSGND
jgi:hypothetical protein